MRINPKTERICFDDKLDTIRNDYAMPLAVIADTCDMAKRWFDDEDVDYTANDLLRFTELVLQVHARIKDDERSFEDVVRA